MKAIEYYETYGDQVFGEAVKSAIRGEQTAVALSELMRAFIRETKEIIKSRNVTTDRGAISVIREQNEKWNALVAIFEKQNKVSPIVRNGFQKYVEAEIPALRYAKP